MTKMLLIPARGIFAGLLALLVLIAELPAQAQEAKPRVAVLQFQRVSADEAEATATADQLRTELVKLQAFTVLERSQTDAVLGELAFQQEGLTEPSRAAKAGQLLNVQFVVTGRITRLQGAYQVNVQMTDVKTGEIVRSESVLHQGDFVGLLSAQVPRLAARLARLESAPPPAAVTAAPAESSPLRPSRHDESRRWPAMGMMGGVTANWPLVVGGMMVMGGAMIAARSDSANRDAALAVGAVGVGLLAYHLVFSSAPPAAAALDYDRTETWRIVLTDLRRDGVQAGIVWPW